MPPKELTAIVCSGGGMRCTYSAGTLSALAQEYGLTEPYLVIGNSGSAGSLAYYLTGQFDSLRNIWTNILTSRKFIWPLRFWNICNVDWLIDDVIKKIDPLDQYLLSNSKTRFLISAFDLNDGSIKYFDKNDGDIFELLRATKAMSLIYNHDVEIDGKPYRDAALCTSIPGLIEQAFSLGATRVIAIENGPRGSSVWMKLYTLLLPPTLRKSVQHEQRREKTDYTSHMKDSKNIVWICPQTLPVTLLENSHAKLVASFELGYKDAKENPKLKEFFHKT